MASKCFLRQKHTVKSIVLSVLCHLSQTIYLTQQNIISSSNGQLAYPHLTNTFYWGMTSKCSIFLVMLKYVVFTDILSIHYPFTYSHPFAVKSPLFI